jgi:hypothetical protein
MKVPSAPVCAAWLAFGLAQATPQLSPEVMAKPAQLFPVAPATAGAGPAVIEYWLDGPARRVALTIRSPAGSQTVMLVPGRKRGVNRVTWDLRIVPPGIDAMEVRKEAAKNMPMPLALPGDYTVRLTVDQAVHEQPLRVSDDASLKMTPAERKVWTDTQVKLWQTAYGAERQRETVVALGEQARMQPGTRLKATIIGLKTLEEPLEEIGEHSEALLKKIIATTRPVGAGDIAKANDYAAALEKRRIEARALQAGMRPTPAR